VVGCRLVFRDGTPDVFAWPKDRAAYGRLCRLLTLGNRRAEKGACYLDRSDLLAWGNGMILGVVPDEDLAAPALLTTLSDLVTAFPGDVRLMGSFAYRGDDHRRLALMDRLARGAGVTMVATNDVH